MKFLQLLAYVSIPTLLISCTSPKNASDHPWAQVKTPLRTDVKSIGKYSEGCLIGGQSLDPVGPGYQVMKISRKRFYGHPKLVHFIEQLGLQIRREQLGQLLIGDMAQARGGPMPGGHVSHQSGLDVDIWFLLPPAGNLLDLETTENAVSPSVLRADTQKVDFSQWTAAHRRILYIASQAPSVQRVFVNAAIKKDLCQTFPNEPWLRKVRAWYGHDDHFHVRLRCPSDSPLCVTQPDPPEGDGCDETLDWWFTEEALPKNRKFAKTFNLPKQCLEVLKK